MMGDRVRRVTSPGFRGGAAVAVVALVIAGCASRRPVAPAMPATLAHPEYVYPAIPDGQRATPEGINVDLGWRYLQNDDLRSAEREFSAALKRRQTFYPARTGEGYVALARRDHDRALAAFDAALGAAAAYVPALVGRGLTLLEAKREGEALAALEAAVTADPSLADVRRRVDVLRFRGLQETIEAARRAAAAGQVDEARLAYQRALSASGESGFLHRELGLLERRAGNAGAARERFRRAVELDDTDAVSLIQLGQLFEDAGDFAAAETTYRRAAALEPSAELTATIAAVAERAREARLPPQFREIAKASSITRGELAALIGFRLETLLGRARPRTVVVTDVRGHWAQAWIDAVLSAGVLEPFENHTFQPRQRVRRADLAGAVRRLAELVAERDAALKARLAQRPKIADIGPAHLNYPAVSVAVASGIMPLLDGDRFQVSRAVTGAEAIEVVDHIRRLDAR
jgi:tetratricopeptide (TPR) repeat protein